MLSPSAPMASECLLPAIAADPPHLDPAPHRFPPPQIDRSARYLPSKPCFASADALSYRAPALSTSASAAGRNTEETPPSLSYCGSRTLRCCPLPTGHPRSHQTCALRHYSSPALHLRRAARIWQQTHIHCGPPHCDHIASVLRPWDTRELRQA